MFPKPNTQSAPARRRILVIDDHPLVRRGLRTLIDAEPDLVVCAEAATRENALRVIAAARPDLVIADLSLGLDDGLELVRQICYRPEGPRVLVLSMHEAPLVVRRAFAAGADGYVAKREVTETLLMASRCVLIGRAYGAPGG